MTWSIEFLNEAEKDMKKLDHSVQIQVLKGIRKVGQNPLPIEEGGYGKPLGNKSGINLTNFMKIKFRDLGIRVVYKVEHMDGVMKIIVPIVGGLARASNKKLSSKFSTRDRGPSPGMPSYTGDGESCRAGCSVTQPAPACVPPDTGAVSLHRPDPVCSFCPRR